MKIVVLEERVRYDGHQLASDFFDQHAAGHEDAAVLFSGEADVAPECMVDLEDAEAGLGIYSPLMAHVLLEHRGIALSEGVWRQRLFMRLAGVWISARSGAHVDVRGDDLYVGTGKLSVSIATTCSRSVLMHVGVNVETEGTPVPTAGLRDLRIRPSDYLREVCQLYRDEVASVMRAVGKVRPVA